jgi:hypothetical protein
VATILAGRFFDYFIHLEPPSKKQKTSLILINQGDRVILVKKPIINEVKRLWHKVFYHSSTNRRKRIRG